MLIPNTSEKDHPDAGITTPKADEKFSETLVV
jgi:hypothetical protein